jgi:hypothetical protein
VASSPLPSSSCLSNANRGRRLALGPARYRAARNAAKSGKAVGS